MRLFNYEDEILNESYFKKNKPPNLTKGLRMTSKLSDCFLSKHLFPLF